MLPAMHWLPILRRNQGAWSYLQTSNPGMTDYYHQNRLVNRDSHLSWAGLQKLEILDVLVVRSHRLHILENSLFSAFIFVSIAQTVGQLFVKPINVMQLCVPLMTNLSSLP